jgi:hypothetical protein
MCVGEPIKCRYRDVHAHGAGQPTRLAFVACIVHNILPHIPSVVQGIFKTL